MYVLVCSCLFGCDEQICLSRLCMCEYVHECVSQIGVKRLPSKSSSLSLRRPWCAPYSLIWDNLRKCWQEHVYVHANQGCRDPNQSETDIRVSRKFKMNTSLCPPPSWRYWWIAMKMSVHCAKLVCLFVYYNTCSSSRITQVCFG